MKYSCMLWFLLFSSAALANRALSEPEKFKNTIKSDCLGVVEQYEDLMTKEYLNHLSRLSIDRLHSLLKVRRAIINDGALSSQEEIDDILAFELGFIMRRDDVTEYQKSQLQEIKAELTTFPLAIDNIALRKLKGFFKKHKL